jgi:hypothetical protein
LCKTGNGGSDEQEERERHAGRTQTHSVHGKISFAILCARWQAHVETMQLWSPHKSTHTLVRIEIEA